MNSKKSSYGWIVFLGLSISFLAIGAIYNTVSMYISPIITAHPEITRSAFTMTTTIQSTVTIIISLFLGKIIKKLGMRNLLLIGCLCAGISQGIYSVGSSLWMFYCAAAIYGIALPFTMFVAAPILVNAWFKKNTGLLLGLASAFISFGGAVCGPLVGSWITNMGYQNSYRTMMFVITTCGIIAFVLVRNNPPAGVLRIGEEPDNDNKTSTYSSSVVVGTTLAEAKKMPKYYALLFSTFLGMFAYAPMMVTLPVFSIDIGFTPIQAGTVMSCYSIAAMIFTVLVGILCEKIGSRNVLLFGGITTITAALLLLNIKILPAETMYIIAMLVGYSMITPLVPYQMAIREVYGLKEFAGLFGLCTSVRTIGTATGVPLMQLVYDKMGSYNIAFIAIIIIAVIIMVSLFYAIPAKKKALSSIQIVITKEDWFSKPILFPFAITYVMLITTSHFLIVLFPSVSSKMNIHITHGSIKAKFIIIVFAYS